MKIRILKWLFSIILSLLKGERYLFLLSYIRGRGGNRDVTRYFTMAIRKKMATMAQNGIVYWHRTIEYEGSGFWGRPELFYLIGCFTSQVQFTCEGIRFFGQDRYDWHPDQSGQFYSSGLPSVQWLRPLHRLAQIVFGREYFPTQGWPMGNPGISNKLWMDMARVGARPFDSIWDFTVPWSEIEEDWEYNRDQEFQCDDDNNDE